MYPWSTKPNPKLSAGFFSKLILWWANEILSKGYHRHLEDRDVYEVLPEDSSIILVNDLAREWEKELYQWRTSGQSSLLRALLRCYGSQLIGCGITLFLEESLKIGLVVLIGELIWSFEASSSYTQLDIYLLALGISLAYLFMSIVSHTRFHFYHQGLKIQSAVTGLIYRKILKLSYNNILGEVAESPLNLIASDAKRLETSILMVQHVWIGIAEACAIVPLLWLYVGFGPVCLVAVAVLTLLIPFQLIMGHQFAKQGGRAKIYRSTRATIMEELIATMKFLKINCWERPFTSHIAITRRNETRYNERASQLRGLTAAIHVAFSKIAVFLVILVYVMIGHSFSAKQVIVMLALVEILHTNFSLFLPWCAADGAQLLNSIKKIQDFLTLEEKTLEHDNLQDEPSLAKDTVIKFNDYSANWNINTYRTKTVLDDINLEIKRGQFVCITGPRGSGKSSILSSILGELQTASGSIQVKGKLGYISKHSWIFAGSIRDNVLFSADFDSDRYRRIIDACELVHDIERYSAGDLSEIRDQDITPDDGIRVRLALARAIYNDADIFLLDDPFSLMEISITNRILTRCLHGLLRDKTIILISNNAHQHKAATQVIEIEGGRVTSVIEYDKYLKADGNGYESLRDCRGLISKKIANGDLPEKVIGELEKLKKLHTTDIDEVEIELEMWERYFYELSVFEDGEKLVPRSRDSGLMEVTWRTYLRYFNLGWGVCGIVLLGLLLFLTQVSYVMFDWWLAYWVIQNEQLNQPNATVSDPISLNRSEMNGVLILLGVGLSLLILVLCRSVTYYGLMGKIARILHRRVVNAVMSAPLQYVQANESQLTKMFSTDMFIIDDAMLVQMFDTLQFFFSGLCTVVLIGGCNPWMFLLLIPQTIIYIFLRYYYLAAACDLRQLESHAKEQAYTHVSNTMHGIRPIRSLDSQERYLRHFDHKQDHLTATSYLMIEANQWLAVRLDCILIILVTMLAFISVVAASDLRGSLVGLALVYGVRLHWLCHLSTRQSSQLAHMMTSVSRLLHHKNLEAEGPIRTTLDLAQNWPPYGIITYEGTTLQYKEKSPKVLRNFWCCFRAYEKVGVLRRKGADPHALISSLLHLVPYKGSIWIDAVNLREVALSDLRERICVIPDDPKLISGSLRQNLDPLSKLTDVMLWKVLEDVQMKTKVECLPNKLHTIVSTDKPIFSSAQIQLLCLARALLKGTTVLVLEEIQTCYDARANSAIQSILRSRFEQCTVIVITHRIQSVVDFDRVLIMDNGRVLEYDPPHILLQNPLGIFKQMFSELSAKDAILLREMAQYKFENKPYVPPPMDERTLHPESDKAFSRPSRNFLPAFQTSRLTSVLSNLTPSNI
ncbi:ATP-binding cassette sub-family C member 4-like isoform X2 [Lineus longissimus]|uniref:ATP-binding cassette sub-family C member 4-like isoform X2 n=1 Tax=Lineus longissimus TaxID=88925 RepID=UPI00315D8C58